MTTFPNTNILINTQRSRFIIKVTITKNVLSQKEHPARLQKNKIDSMKYILIKFGGNNVFFLNGIFYCVLTLKKKKPFWLGKSAFPGAKGLWSMPLMCSLTNPEPYFLNLSHVPQEPIFFCLNHSRARDQATRHPPHPRPPIA